MKEYIAQQQENRKLWEGNDSTDLLLAMLAHEMVELAESVQESYITGDVFSVASELGDVGYLWMRICIELALDPDDVVEMKILRNSGKYLDHVMSNGRNYDEAVAVSKAQWSALGGDKAWSHVFLDHLAHD